MHIILSLIIPEINTRQDTIPTYISTIKLPAVSFLCLVHFNNANNNMAMTTHWRANEKASKPRVVLFKSEIENKTVIKDKWYSWVAHIHILLISCMYVCAGFRGFDVVV